MSVALLVLPDFLLIALGALLARAPFVRSAHREGLERLVYFVLFPALLFRSLYSVELDFAGAWRVGVAGVAFTLAGIALALAGRRLLRLPEATFAACFQCAFRFNTYLALAVTSRIAGERGSALLSLLIGLLVPLVNVAAVAMLAHGRPKHVAREIARNPLVLACAAGLACNFTAVPLPGVLMSTIGLAASAALPLGLVAVGTGLAFRADALPPRALAYLHAVKLVALPATALGLAHLLHLDQVARLVVVVMAAVPTAPSAYVLAVRMRAPGAPVALLITSGTLASVLTLTAWLAFAGVPD